MRKYLFIRETKDVDGFQIAELEYIILPKFQKECKFETLEKFFFLTYTILTPSTSVILTVLFAPFLAHTNWKTAFSNPKGKHIVRSAWKEFGVSALTVTESS